MPQLCPPARVKVKVFRSTAAYLREFSDAPREYVQTPSAFRLYNPSLAWRTGDRVTTDGITGRDSSVIHVFAKMSSYSLCGASDEYDSVAASRRVVRRAVRPAELEWLAEWETAAEDEVALQSHRAV